VVCHGEPEAGAVGKPARCLAGVEFHGDRNAVGEGVVNDGLLAGAVGEFVELCLVGVACDREADADPLEAAAGLG
jgi:hypothetical protein